jgi:hypothetical protein
LNALAQLDSVIESRKFWDSVTFSTMVPLPPVPLSTGSVGEQSMVDGSSAVFI